MKTRIVIPARMASTRLPGKPLVDIGGTAMVLRVANVARKAGFGEPLIAAGDREIFDCATRAGYQAVLTPADLPSGTDRIQAALDLVDDAQDLDCVVNLQGDLPNIDPKLIQQVVKVLVEMPNVQIASLMAPITSQREKNDPNVVKAIVSNVGIDGPNLFRALYFTRASAPSGTGPMFEHIGIYAYRRQALSDFTSHQPTALEKSEKLEQLRALEHGMQIGLAQVDQVPHGVDSPQDLARIRAWFGENS